MKSKKSKSKGKSKFLASMIKLTCLTGAMFLYSASVFAAVDLPTGGQIAAGSGNIAQSGNVMNISGLDNTIIKWNSFNIGAKDTVNFTGSGDTFNVLNYVSSAGGMSKIYGQMNGVGGNVYLVNPAGVYISSAASIDVGSLYVSNKKIDALENWQEGQTINESISKLVNSGQTTGAELMMLGNITADRITFDGDRIVLDTKRDLLTEKTQNDGTSIADNMNLDTKEVTDGTIQADKLTIITTDKNEVVVGYAAYDDYTSDKDGNPRPATGYANAPTDVKLANIQVRGADGSITSPVDLTSADGYLWVDEYEQLQSIGAGEKTLGRNYALHNGIDASASEETPFTPIGTEDAPFTGKLDGLGSGSVDDTAYSIFDLHVAGTTQNVGLFGVTENATLRNLTLSYGSVEGTENVGALVGLAKGGEIKNIRNSINVTGAKAVGGIVGKAENVSMSNLMNSGTITGSDEYVVEVTSSGVLSETSTDIDTLVQPKDSVALGGAIDYTNVPKATYDKITTTTTKHVATSEDNSGNVEVTEVTEDLHSDFYDLKTYSNTSSVWILTGIKTTKTWTEDAEGKVIGDVVETIEDDPQLVISNYPAIYDTSKNEYTAYYVSTSSTVAGMSWAFKVSAPDTTVTHNYGGTQMGGIVGSMTNGSLAGAENVGAVSGRSLVNVTTMVEPFHDIGGIVGYAETSGDDGKLVFSDLSNEINVSGGYNVGGIIGSVDASAGEGISLSGASNNGTVLAEGEVAETYTYLQGVTVSTDDNVAENSRLVDVANVGGIIGNLYGKGELSDMQNYANVSSNMLDGTDYYIAGNVGGIIGKAQSSAITTVAEDGSESSSRDASILKIKNTLNKENLISGAHNVGGIVGYLEYAQVEDAENNGAEITGTGARYVESEDNTYSGTARGSVANAMNSYYESNGFIAERVRAAKDHEDKVIGNIGGIVGYAYGDDVSVSGASNTGNIHSALNESSQASRAGNIGGIVGKLDTPNRTYLSDIVPGTKEANITYSSNSGKIQGYINVGGIVGSMFNGSVAHSYNEGNILSSRTDISKTPAYVNLGGIVGDSPEFASSWSSLYDVYNTGTIGDENFVYRGRHEGGIAGRYTGDIEKAYNTGDIYNASSITGGIIGYFAGGILDNVFNTGNVTGGSNPDDTGYVGGITSDISGQNGVVIQNAYNLGTLRNFANITNNAIGGIFSGSTDYREYDNGVNNHPDYNNLSKWVNLEQGFQTYSIKLSNVYTTTNEYSDQSNTVNYLYYATRIQPNVLNGYVILLDDANVIGTEMLNGVTTVEAQGATAVSAADMYNANSYRTVKLDSSGAPVTDENGNPVYEGLLASSAWRMYDGTTLPMLNAFLPTLATVNANTDANGDNTGVMMVANSLTADGYTLQYGTAYNPLLTIVTYQDNVKNGAYELDWSGNGLAANESVAVYNGGLSVANLSNAGDYFGGTLYADDLLSITNAADDILLGANAALYGKSISLSTEGNVVGYGEIHSAGDISISGDAGVELIGKVIAKDTDTAYVSGISNFFYTPEEKSAEDSSKEENDTAEGDADAGDTDAADTDAEADAAAAAVAKAENDAKLNAIDQHYSSLNDEFVANYNWYDTASAGNRTMKDIPNIGAWYHADMPVDENAAGTITITSKNGDVEAYYGVRETGILQAEGGLTVEAVNKIYIDADMKGYVESLSVNGGTVATDGSDYNREIVLDMSNIGKTEENAGATVYGSLEALNAANKAIVMSGTNNAMLALDFWDEDAGQYNGEKYNPSADQSLVDLLQTVEVDVNGTNSNGLANIYAWISSGEELAALGNFDGDEAVKYNFALKNNIDASNIVDYVPLGTDGAMYSGTFNGRNYKIIDLAVENDDNAGIFGAIGKDGVVKNLAIYSSSSTGTNAGLIAGVSAGTIENIETFGNKVEGIETAGGLVGKNLDEGSIIKVDANDTIIASENADYENGAAAGGIAGINLGSIGKSDSDGYEIFVNSAVLSKVGLYGWNADAAGNVTDTYNVGLGGVVGINEGTLQYAENIGIVNGNQGEGYFMQTSDNVGGIVGYNKGIKAGVNEALNLAHVTGGSNVGGVVGKSDSSTIADVANAGKVISEGGIGILPENTGGIAGELLSTTLRVARNSGDVTGVNNVGGLLGHVDDHSLMENIVNDGFVTIDGQNYVGGVIGYNEGTLDLEQMDLENKGVIYGNTYVGGVVGKNTGIIKNPQADVTLYVNGDNAQYFGGIAGENAGMITGANNSGKIQALGASYVGGLVGLNSDFGFLIGGNNLASGEVVGANLVGGVIGLNKGFLMGETTMEADGTFSRTDTTIGNYGKVIATNGGAGGIFGVNYTDTSDVTFVNNGIVMGNTQLTDDPDAMEGSGGLAGVNYATYTNVTIANMVNGLVIDTNNAGGIFGVNHGSLEGARSEDENASTDDYYAGDYYKYGVLNNGLVMTTNFKSEDYVDATKAEIFAAAKGVLRDSITADNTNAGGIVGYNATPSVSSELDYDGNPIEYKSSIIAAYNTGKVLGGTNVGGIVGYNKGTVEQSFNNVFGVTERDEDGNALDLANDSIEGLNNVGGIVGYNDTVATIRYSYNLGEISLLSQAVANDATAVVVSDAAIGNLVGNNQGTVKQSYATNTTGTLIGTGVDAVESYTLSEGDTTAEYISAEDSLLSASYANLTKDDSNIWKIYEGFNTPLLKVFLTKVDASQLGTINLTYDIASYKDTDVFKPSYTVKQLIENETLKTNHPEGFEHYEGDPDFIQLNISKSEDEVLEDIEAYEAANGSDMAVSEANNNDAVTTVYFRLWSKQNGYVVYDKDTAADEDANAGIATASLSDEDYGIAVASLDDDDDEDLTATSTQSTLVRTVNPNLLGYLLVDSAYNEFTEANPGVGSTAANQQNSGSSDGTGSGSGDGTGTGSGDGTGTGSGSGDGTGSGSGSSDGDYPNNYDPVGKITITPNKYVEPENTDPQPDPQPDPEPEPTPEPSVTPPDLNSFDRELDNTESQAWGKKREYRERKAPVHFEKGAMVLPEDK